ncbi:hypothetical protein Vafri_3131 [Volvox africanus]|uniref:methylated diphthine methylhydrolase n=1 Tax=Volvox africanus TaxID=51714 RepID=A0A8J4ARM9_9CHLO|nr:hypothetical protein Vafri_3131 [Volvox africanus]
MAAMLASEPVIMYSEVLDFNADCAEFCPLPGLNYLLALGTYQLLEETQERLGRCYLRALQLSGAAEQPQGSTNAGSLDMPGIFDLKWRPPACDTRKAMLGAALADGTVRLMEVFEDGAAVTRPQLRLQSQVAACSSGMCLSLDWQAAHGGAVARIATSSSAGTLSLLQATNSELSHLCEWKAHDLEAWCTAFHKAEENILFSGADDCYFKAYDIRSDPASPIFSNRRTHAAGVCTVSPHPKEHHIVATGSYDEHVRIWDMRNTSKPVVISQVLLQDDRLPYVYILLSDGGCGAGFEPPT